MLQSLVITLREGVEAALVVGIVLGYLRKSGRERWSVLVYWALLAALLTSLVVGYLLHRLQVTEEAYEGWLMLAGAVFVSSMVIWMWRTGKHLKQDVEHRLSRISASPSRGATLGIFLFVFLMVVREGIETVLFLAAVSLRTSELMNFMGGLIGLGLAVALGVAFFKGSVKVDLRKFFTVTTLVLLVVATQLLLAGIHELSEARVLPSSPREMALVGPVVNNDALFFVAVVALALFLVIAQQARAGGSSKVEQKGLSAPERRKARAEAQRARFWKAAASATSLLVLVLISAQYIYSRTAQALSPPERLTAAEGVVRLAVNQLADRKLHRFVVSVAGAEVRLIAILDSSDTVRTGLDACEICGSQGYYQDGKNVICRNCAAAIYIPTIGIAGGCNPIHIDYHVEGETLLVSEADLAAAAKHFR